VRPHWRGGAEAAHEETLDELLSTSRAAAEAAFEKRPSPVATTEPRPSYAMVAKKIRVAVLPVEYPQVYLSHGDLLELEELIYG